MVATEFSTLLPCFKLAVRSAFMPSQLWALPGDNGGKRAAMLVAAGSHASATTIGKINREASTSVPPATLELATLNVCDAINPKQSNGQS